MLQKRLAAQILKCSKNRIKLDSTQMESIKEAITKQDIRGLIKGKVISRKPKKETSRVRARHIAKQKAKGRQKGQGTRKGKKTARTPKKERWMNAVRIQRAILKNLRSKGFLKASDYHNLYRKVKGGFFRSQRHIKIYMKEKGLIE